MEREALLAGKRVPEARGVEPREEPRHTGPAFIMFSA